MGCLDMDDPLSLGFIGRNGAYPANEAGRRADLVLALGARFDDRSASSWLPGYSWNFPTTKLIHVDLDPAELGRNYPPDIGILADARTFLRQLLAELDTRRLETERTKAWLADIARWRAEWETFTQPNFERARFTDPAGAHRRRLPRGAARRRHSGLRRRRQSQLVHAVLEGAQTADDAQLVGLLRHGLWRCRCARRQACRAGPAGAWRLPATAASPWCRTCCARRSNTTSRWSG